MSRETEILKADEIEKIKENIQPISKGYKTLSLKRRVPSGPGPGHDHEIERERRLKLESLLSKESVINDLTPFMDYLNWTREHYPSGHSSITKVTEDAIRRFRKDERYKNDFRYVELWMALGKQQQDAGDLFKYLVVNGIGTQCALFYEEYAGYKESMGCMEQAGEIYRKGISNKAAPLSRLVRQYDAFLIRSEEASHSNYKSSNFKSSGILKERDLPEFYEEEEENHPAPQRRFSIALPALPKCKTPSAPLPVKSKLRVFKDAEDQRREDSLFPAPPSKEAVEMAEYDLNPIPKENTKDAENWAGSVLPQQPASHIVLPPKMNVFRDEDEEVVAIQDSRAKKSKKSILQPSIQAHVASSLASVMTEQEKTHPVPIAAGAKMVAHLSMCYQDNIEYCFEENRADLCHMNELVHKFSPADVTIVVKPSRLTQATPKKRPESLLSGGGGEAPSPWHSASNAPLGNGESRLSSPGKEKGAIQDIFKMLEEEKAAQAAIFYTVNSPKAKATEEKPRPPSPTIHTKEAMSAISAMFGNPLGSADEGANFAEQEICEIEVTPAGDAIIYNPEDDETISRQVYKRPESSIPLKIGVFKDEESDEDELPPLPDLQTPFQSRPITNLFGQQVHVMTPVTECSEKTHSYTNHSISTGPSEVLSRPPIILEEEERTENTMLFLKSKITAQSSTKLDQVFEEVAEKEVEEADSFEEPSATLPSPCNPSIVRQAILSKTRPPPECKLFVLASVESQLGATIMKNQGDKLSFTFTADIEKYHLLNRLGSSNYYAIERDGSGAKSVVRLQDPPSVWEFYMLYSLHSKIPEAFKNSIAKPISCYLFKNESFTELEYIEGGSLLDAIRKLNYNGPGIPEIVAAFWTLKLITILEFLHSRRIIHGDIQINNLMISGKGTNPRKKFDLVLNDFSASIDMSDCPEYQTFQIENSSISTSDDFMDEDLASSECWEFRNNIEWTFEPDWFGAAGVIHMLVFGGPLSITESSTGISSYSTSRKPFIDIRNSLPVHFGEMWGHAFSTLLNLTHKEANPGASPLDSLKREFLFFVSTHDHLLDDAFARCKFDA